MHSGGIILPDFSDIFAGSTHIKRNALVFVFMIKLNDIAVAVYKPELEIFNFQEYSEIVIKIFCFSMFFFKG